MKKRIITLILAMLTCFASTFGMVGCNQNKQFTVTFVAGREGAVLADSFDQSVLVQTVSDYRELIVPVFVCEGAWHHGWDKAISMINKDTEIKAQWTESSFTVKFSSGVEDATLISGQETCTTNSVMSIKFPKYIRPGYTQDETWGGIDLQSIKIPYGEKNPTISFTASWIPNKYKISFVDDDGVTELFDKKEVCYDSQIGELPVPEKDNAVFAGWKVKDKSTVLFAEKVYRYADDITLQAVWAPDGYFYISYLNVEEVNNPLVYSPNDRLILNKPNDKVGYSFLGWTYGEQLEPKIDVMIEKGTVGNLVFTAHWKAKEFGITLNHENGNTSQIVVTYGEKVGEMPIPEKEGFKFVGWSTQHGTAIDEETVWMIDDNTVYLVAKYLRIYTIKYVLQCEVEYSTVICKFDSKTERAMKENGFIKSEDEENVWILSGVLEGTVLKDEHLYSPKPIDDYNFKFSVWTYGYSDGRRVVVKGSSLANETIFPESYESGVITLIAQCESKWSPWL